MLAFSVRTLLAVVAVAAVAISALIQRTPIWTSALVSLAMAMFMVAAILAMLRPAKRTFWLPVAVIGWTYLAIVFVQPLEGLHRSLITAPLVVKVAQRTLPATEVPTWIRMQGGFGGGGPAGGYLASGGSNPDPNASFPPSITPLAAQSPFSAPPEMSTTELMPHVLSSPYTYPTISEFYFSLQSLLAMLLAVAGGLTVQYFLGRSPPKPADNVDVQAKSGVAV